MRVWRRRDWLVVAPLGLCASCDPLIDVAGAFFPAWILCIVIALVATVLLRLVFARTRIEPGLGPLVVIYPSLATALALTAWLLFFPAVNAAMRVVAAIVTVAIFVGMAVAIAASVIVSHRRPLTDDASVRANLIGIAPHVSGPLAELHVVDNQPVHKGDLLFIVDPRPYQARLDQAEAELKLTEREISAQRNSIAASEHTVRQRRVEYAYAENYVQRLAPLLPRDFVTADKVEEARTRRETALAALGNSRQELARANNLLAEYGTLNARRQAAQARVEAARLDVAYCRVGAPFDGYVTNLNISEGDYALEGRQIFALVDTRTWYVVGNFRETFLRDIRPGMAAEIYVLDYPGRRLRGEVQGIGWAVQQRDGPGTGLLPPVEPTLNWVRLAQRFPVRVRIVDPPPDTPLRVGQTAAITVVSAR